MTHSSGGSWPHDPDAFGGRRSLDDLEIPDDEPVGDDPGYTIDPDDEVDAAASEYDSSNTDDLIADDAALEYSGDDTAVDDFSGGSANEPTTDEWGDDADNRLVDLDDDDDDLDR